MITDTDKTIVEYTIDFEKDYQNIVNHKSKNTSLPIMNPSQPIEIYTVYTNNTPVTASNASIIVKL